MTASAIGIFLGLAVILLTVYMKWDKPTLYGLVLSGIGFLYVGFTWTDFPSLVVTIIQAVVFLLLAHYGIRKSSYFLIAGYLLHGVWDISYGHVGGYGLIPPHYDLFCLSIDFTMGFYLLWIKPELDFRLKMELKKG